MKKLELVNAKKFISLCMKKIQQSKIEKADLNSLDLINAQNFIVICRQKLQR